VITTTEKETQPQYVAQLTWSLTPQLDDTLFTFEPLEGGVSLEGMVISPRGQLNRAYYEGEVSPLDILVNQKVHNPGASELVTAVTELASAGQ